MTEYYEDMLEMVSNSGSSDTSIFAEDAAAVATAKKKAPKKRKEEKPVYFKSNIRGRRIVYADTGIITPHLVGTRDEDLYFKVNFTSHRFEGESSAIFLYYDNPMDYCIHYYMQLCRNKRVKYEDPEILKERIETMYARMEESGIVEVWRRKRDYSLYIIRCERAEEEDRTSVLVK